MDKLLFLKLYAQCEYVVVSHNISNAKVVGYRYGVVSSHFEIYEGGSYTFNFLIDGDFIELTYPKDTGAIKVLIDLISKHKAR